MAVDAEILRLFRLADRETKAAIIAVLRAALHSEAGSRSTVSDRCQPDAVGPGFPGLPQKSKEKTLLKGRRDQLLRRP